MTLVRRALVSLVLCLATTAAAATPQGPLRGEPVSISVKDGQLSEVIRILARVGDMNLVLDPSVSGKTITLNLEGVPWDQALDIVLTSQGLASDINGNVLRVAPAAKLVTEANQAVQLREARESAGEVRTIAVALSNADAATAEAIIRRSLTSRGSTSVDKRTNTIFITDVFPSAHGGFAEVVALSPARRDQPAEKLARFTIRLIASDAVVADPTILHEAHLVDSTEIELPVGGTASLLLGDPTDGSAVRLTLSGQLDGGQVVLAVRGAALDRDRGTINRAVRSGEAIVVPLNSRPGSGSPLLMAFDPLY